MPNCAVKWCINRSSIHTKAVGISFHSISHNINVRKLWINAMRLERHDPEWMPNKFTRICSVHFQDEDFYVSEKGYKKLFSHAVPICTMVLSKENFADLSPQLKLQHFSKFNKGKSTNGQICNKILLTPKVEVKQEHILDSKNVDPIPTNDPVKQERRWVSCPNCSCDLYLITDSNGQEALEIPMSLDDNMLVTNLKREDPLDISTYDSNVPSAMDSVITNKHIKDLKKKTELAQKRLSKLKTLKRRNDRLIKKNLTLKNLVKELKKSNLIKKKMSAPFCDVPRDTVSNIKKSINKKRNHN